MARGLVSVTTSVWVGRDPEAVFDHTQDYERRPGWDPGITEAAIVGVAPRAARITMRGLGRATIVYRLDRRPERTSAVFEDVESPWIVGGGGSWAYEPEAGGTRWTATNSLELRRGWWTPLLAPFARWSLRRSTERAMRAAKRQLETAGPGTTPGTAP